MDFIDQVKQLSIRVNKLKDSIKTEEATKTSLIMPFFSMLGYDVFNPEEFIPEFTADVGIKKGEKVDYAIISDGEPVILIEAKWCDEKLDKHDSQLFRYFGTTKAKFAILTNGIIYKFYTDLENINKMDEKPFWIFDLLNPKENQVAELKKFCKGEFDVESILTTASELKYSNEFKQIFARQLQNPSDDLIRLFLAESYNGVKTQNVIEKFKPILKQSLNNYISELMSDKIQSALSQEDNIDDEPPIIDTPKPVRKIVTTDEELEAFFIIKNLLKDITSMEDITYKDTVNYLSILLKHNGRKWICRLNLTPSTKILIIPDENKNPQKHHLNNIYDLYQYKELLIEVLKRYI